MPTRKIDNIDGSGSDYTFNDFEPNSRHRLELNPVGLNIYRLRLAGHGSAQCSDSGIFESGTMSIAGLPTTLEYNYISQSGSKLYIYQRTSATAPVSNRQGSTWEEYDLPSPADPIWGNAWTDSGIINTNCTHINAVAGNPWVTNTDSDAMYIAGGESTRGNIYILFRATDSILTVGATEDADTWEESTAGPGSGSIEIFDLALGLDSNSSSPVHLALWKDTQTKVSRGTGWNAENWIQATLPGAVNPDSKLGFVINWAGGSKDGSRGIIVTRKDLDEGAVYVSDTISTSWSEEFTNSKLIYPINIAVDPINNGSVYIGSFYPDPTGAGVRAAYFKSTDYGDNWAEIEYSRSEVSESLNEASGGVIVADLNGTAKVLALTPKGVLWDLLADSHIATLEGIEKGRLAISADFTQVFCCPTGDGLGRQGYLISPPFDWGAPTAAFGLDIAYNGPVIEMGYRGHTGWPDIKTWYTVGPALDHAYTLYKWVDRLPWENAFSSPINIDANGRFTQVKAVFRGQSTNVGVQLNYIWINYIYKIIMGKTYDQSLRTIYPSAKVRCYSETSGALIAETTSGVNGSYTLYVPDGDTYFIVGDDGTNATAGIVDNIIPS